MGQVRAAAKAAQRATRGDESPERIASLIPRLVARASAYANEVEVAEHKLVRIDRADLLRRREAVVAAEHAKTDREPEHSRSQGPLGANGPDVPSSTVTWLDAEIAEADRLEREIETGRDAIDKIASALRVIALRARSERGARALRVELTDGPVDVDDVARELSIREDALAEVDRVC